ncbi:hypothetical protein MB46_00675 [Arthrobacter alpinus]|uniref:glycan biosynthesis hexose transferase WsfD n=1 Tax=Arthrobacter alpinus TaxID=656366 RepID=UPI0005C8379E|nr:hypothetical protein [Arthrobacter alpinus]ALV44246.1 hypothetical protein MB46_00675 [Arthrobacter alpinus]
MSLTPPPLNRRGTPSVFRRALTRLSPGNVTHDGAVRSWIPWLAGCVSTAFLLFRLLVPTTVGMGDQGDGRRLLCPLGVANVRPWAYSDFTKYIYPRWEPHQWFGEACGADGSGEPYYSSQTLLLWPAKALSALLGWGPGLDTRAVAIMCCIVFGVLTAFLITQLPGRVGFRLLAAALFTLVSADGIFADFFVSGYSEPAAFLGVYATVIALLYWWRHPRHRLIGLLLVLAAAAFMIAAKTQTASFIPVIVLALCWQPESDRPLKFRDSKVLGIDARVRRRRPGRAKIGRYAPALAGLLLLGTFTAAFSNAQPQRFTELNLYNAVFTEMLPHSPAPDADLRWLGLDPSFIDSSGTTVASSNAAVYNPHYEQFLQKVSLPKIGLFYISHPDRLASMASRGLDAMTQPELGYLGSYEEGTGHAPHEKERRVAPVLLIFTAFRDAPGLLVGLQLTTLFLGLGAAFSARSSRAGRAVGKTAVVLVPAIWLQFWAVMMTEGQSEIYKHLIIADYMTALCLPLLLILIVIQLRSQIPAPALEPDSRGESPPQVSDDVKV